MFAGFLISDTLLVLQLAVLLHFLSQRHVQCDRDNFPFGIFSALCDNIFWVAFSFHANFLVWDEVSSRQVMKEKR